MLRHLLIRNKYTTLKTKHLIYKTLLKPISTYGLQLWRSAKESNTNKIQVFQNIILRRLSNVPLFISNPTLHNNFHIKTEDEEALIFYLCFHSRLANHTNPFIKNLSIQTVSENPPRKLKRKWYHNILQNPITYFFLNLKKNQ